MCNWCIIFLCLNQDIIVYSVSHFQHWTDVDRSKINKNNNLKHSGDEYIMFASYMCISVCILNNHI